MGTFPGREIQRQLKTIPPKYNQIIIQCWINDFEALGHQQTSHKIRDVIDTAKQCHPTSKTYICQQKNVNWSPRNPSDPYAHHQPLQPRQLTAVYASKLIEGATSHASRVTGLSQSRVTSPPVSICAWVARSNRPNHRLGRTLIGLLWAPLGDNSGADTTIRKHSVINFPGSDEAGCDKGLTNKTR